MKNIIRYQDSDISILLELRLFFLKFWKKIILFGFVGLIFSLFYILRAPIEYEAIAKVMVARNNSGGATIFPTEIFEDRSILIEKLTSLNEFGTKVKDACNLNIDQSKALSSIVTFNHSKVSNSIFEFKVRMQNSRQAVICAEAIFEKVNQIQAESIMPYTDELKSLQKKYESRLALLESRYYGAYSSQAITHEIKFLVNEISVLSNRLSSGNLGMTKLIAPIYASNNPIEYPKAKILWFGFLAGCFLAIFWLYICHLFSKK